MQHKYMLYAYAPTRVLFHRVESDGRAWVSRLGETSEFWVGATQLYDTLGDCIKGNLKTLKDHANTLRWEIKDKQRELTDTERMIG